MIVHEKYRKWRQDHEVSEYVQEVEATVSNCLSTAQDKLLEEEGISESARSVVEESLENCGEVVDVATAGIERLISKPTSSCERYDKNLRQLEEIRESLQAE